MLGLAEDGKQYVKNFVERMTKEGIHISLSGDIWGENGASLFVAFCRFVVFSLLENVVA